MKLQSNYLFYLLIGIAVLGAGILPAAAEDATLPSDLPLGNETSAENETFVLNTSALSNISAVFHENLTQENYTAVEDAILQYHRELLNLQQIVADQNQTANYTLEQETTQYDRLATEYILSRTLKTANQLLPILEAIRDLQFGEVDIQLFPLEREMQNIAAAADEGNISSIDDVAVLLKGGPALIEDTAQLKKKVVWKNDLESALKKTPDDTSAQGQLESVVKQIQTLNADFSQNSQALTAIAGQYGMSTATLNAENTVLETFARVKTASTTVATTSPTVPVTTKATTQPTATSTGTGTSTKTLTPTPTKTPTGNETGTGEETGFNPLPIIAILLIVIIGAGAVYVYRGKTLSEKPVKTPISQKEPAEVPKVPAPEPTHPTPVIPEKKPDVPKEVSVPPVPVVTPRVEPAANPVPVERRNLTPGECYTLVAETIAKNRDIANIQVYTPRQLIDAVESPTAALQEFITLYERVRYSRNTNAADLAQLNTLAAVVTEEYS